MTGREFHDIVDPAARKLTALSELGWRQKNKPVRTMAFHDLATTMEEIALAMQAIAKADLQGE